jgi:GNAT superfamily N-acetyltransferase
MAHFSPGSPKTPARWWLDGYVTNMYTLPAYRRRGLARQLLEFLIAHAPGRDQAAVPGI